MWISLCISLCVVVIVKTEDKSKSETAAPQTSDTPDIAYKSRCTRRFTPGVCEEPLSAVWTFEFHLQNCTERLGCVQSHRTNRFRTYKGCMKRCRPLIDVYLHILATDNYTDTFYLRHSIIGKSGRREGEENLMDLKVTLSDIEEDREEKDVGEIPRGEPLFNLYYRDDSDVEFSLPPDIDYVVGRGQDGDPSDHVYED